MLDALRFVQGAVAKKDLVPELRHFSIRGGFITGFNGNLALCSPIDLDLEAYPSAPEFTRAIQACDETAALSLTPKGRLLVKSGTFKAFIPCTTTDLPNIIPEGPRHAVGGPILPVLKELLPFVAQDASRPWAQGVLFRGRSAFATNNVVLVEHWTGVELPIETNIPVFTVKEMLRIGVEPEYFRVDERSITFEYPGGRWLRSTVFATSWPDVSGLLNRHADLKPTPDGLVEALEKVRPFADAEGSVFFENGDITTVYGAEGGARVTLAGLPAASSYDVTQLLNVARLATKIEFDGYPSPCAFQNDVLRGVIIGKRFPDAV